MAAMAARTASWRSVIGRTSIGAVEKAVTAKRSCARSPTKPESRRREAAALDSSSPEGCLPAKVSFMLPERSISIETCAPMPVRVVRSPAR